MLVTLSRPLRAGSGVASLALGGLLLAEMSIVSTWSVAPPTIQIAPPDPPDIDLLDRLTVAAGAPSKNCGQFYLTDERRPAASREDLDRAVACIARCAAARTPAFVVVQLHGIDSWIGSGLLVRRDGRISSYDYDGDPSGGGGAPPTYVERPCNSPVVRAERSSEPQLGCAPDD